MGHRGDTGRHPENSLAAVMAALEGVGAAEIDIRLTADGRLVLAHDPTVEGIDIAGAEWRVLAPLRRAGHPLCLLDEVVGLPGRLDLEVKSYSPALGLDDSGHLALLVAARARPCDIVTSFYWPDLDLIRRRAPEVATGLLVADRSLMGSVVAHAVEMGHVAIAPEDSLIDADLVSRARAAGRAVMAWTVNDPDRAGELYQLGVTAIISDVPRRIHDHLAE